MAEGLGHSHVLGPLISLIGLQVSSKRFAKIVSIADELVAKAVDPYEVVRFTVLLHEAWSQQPAVLDQSLQYVSAFVETLIRQGADLTAAADCLKILFANGFSAEQIFDTHQSDLIQLMTQMGKNLKNNLEFFSMLRPNEDVHAEANRMKWYKEISGCRFTFRICTRNSRAWPEIAGEILRYGSFCI